MDQNIRGWLGDTREAIKKQSPQTALLKSARGIYNGVWFSLSSHWPIGTNIYDKEWDALIILDGCRVDALTEVAPEYEFIDTVESILSVGSSSHEWIAKTFTNKYANEIKNTTLISSNPFSKRVFDDGMTPPMSYSIPISIAKWDVVTSSEFQYYEWLRTHSDPYLDKHDIGTGISAEYVTDRAILAGRTQDSRRLVIHYYQPHRPFIDKAMESGKLLTIDDNPYQARQQGELTDEQLWNRYIDNLRYGLNQVEVLLKNLDAEKVVITADHGELMGEWGVYGHPEGFPHPNLKRVPWVETTSYDSRDYEPPDDVKYETDHNPEKHLKDLGYL